MRWILFFVLLTIGFGVLLNGDFEIPYLVWAGHLPGDLIIRKNGVEIYLPLTTSLLISLLLAFILSLLKRKSGA